MKKLDENLAELVGAFIGDGCLSKYYIENRNKWQQVVLFTGSWKKDFLYYKDVINPIIVKHFNVKCQLYHREDDDTIRFRTYDVKLISFLLDLGFSFGPKANNVVIPEIIFNDKKSMKGCIRGIFNTDGSIYQRYSKKYENHSKHYTNYKVIQFKNKSQELIKQIRFILSKFDLNPNRIINDKKSNFCAVCRITSQPEVKIFEKEINTTHPYHIQRMLNLSKK